MPLERLLDLTESPVSPDQLYQHIVFPAPPEHRPYVYINMASTLDGKIVVGKPHGSAVGVGGPTDQQLFRRLQRTADAVIIGGGTLRAGPVIYPPNLPRYVVTRTGDLPLENRFFETTLEQTFVIAPKKLPADAQARLRSVATLLLCGEEEADLAEAFWRMRQEQKVRYLLCEGGGLLNDALLREGLADELFLTLAPKLKGGAHLPTSVGGIGFPPDFYLRAHLLSVYRDGDELYLRYRLEHTPVSWRAVE
ncbi:pyrimidine reductase, riboflavin biosynthesis [Chthonomonas calidirosea]|uniref:Pyrimidine reductase, riboflavin biosynthesis n=1 Tax=Chthonomonas calidirosea (strain DSM 23976 / ICMP 18418 / T49) TaxID=1303518 RepID=S0EVS8_CHTCT|nr:RibD family protein [Chthonomonas calidirosea]CCW35547.1 Pyrimidine reductase, riboflavin biosynthesis [Chthonomonas calidirosea T49]CEK19947.1 pyrimidine reductase, riboflavin biosynthesis [Chthonomonas calidirosea]